MKNNFKKFMICVQKIPQLRNTFISCKSMEDTYNILKGFRFQKHEPFLKKYVKSKNTLTKKELTGFHKQIFNFRQKILSSISLLVVFANITVLPVVTKNSTSIVFAARGVAFSDSKNEDNQAKNININSTEENEFYDTTEAEVAYGLLYLKYLPKKGEKGFDSFLRLPKFNTLNPNRKETLKVKYGPDKNMEINEQKIYHQIEETVKEIMRKVDARSCISKHKDRSRDLRIAKAIYRWVAKNISYDFDSAIDAGARRKPQDALFVYNARIGVCTGYTKLAKLMLRIANIPSKYVGSIGTQEIPCGHAFNAVYVEDSSSKQTGWALFDSTWASPLSDQNSYFSQLIDENPEIFVEGKSSLFYFENIDLGLNEKYRDELAFSLDSLKVFNILDSLTSLEKIAAVLEKINQDINQRLQKVNEKYEVELKYKSIEIALEDNVSIQNFTGNSSFLFDKLCIKYKTNIDMARAVQFVKERREQRELEELLNESISNLNEVNFNKNPKSYERTISYINNVYELWIKELGEYWADIKINFKKTNLEKINNEIKERLNKLNTQYQDIVVFEEINIEATESNDTLDITVSSKNTLPEKEAQKLEEDLDMLNIKSKESDSFHIYFPTFYNPNQTLAENNESLLRKTAHKIGNPYSFKINGISFDLRGYETNAYIYISGYLSETKDVFIPSELSKLKIPFKIGASIKSLTINGNEEIDLNDATDLERIDVRKCSKYFLRNGTLYKRKQNGTIAEVNICRYAPIFRSHSKSVNV